MLDVMNSCFVIKFDICNDKFRLDSNSKKLFQNSWNSDEGSEFRSRILLEFGEFGLEFGYELMNNN